MTRLARKAAGLAPKTKRGAPHRKKRERRPLPGMLLFQDGSTHRWIPALDHDLDLIVTLNDATGAIYSAILVAQEGTASSFLGIWARRSRRRACFARSTPIGDHTTSIRPRPAARSTRPSSPRSAARCSSLGVTHIPSYSPEARGRMETARR